jgi:UDP-GlcNAc:undecaprenyl-phosphate GlcNAc-1-phosphate transferase
VIGRDDAILILAGLGLLAVSFGLSVGYCALARRWAPGWGLIDNPAAAHKTHKTPTPLGGGVAIWLTVVTVIASGMLLARATRAELPSAVARHIDGSWARVGELAEILALATIIMVMGLFDDRKALSWRLRLGVQVVLATVLAASNVRITLFWPFSDPIVGGLVTVLWIVGLTNAFNMLDNMDGLAAGVGLIAALLFAGAQIAVSSLFTPAVLFVLVGALGGFLVHNRYPAKLFMGDAGSNFLGFLLGALTVAGTYFRYGASDSPFSVFAPLLVMAVPLYDSTSVILIRIREGRSPFLGDRRHFSHRLVERGLTPRQAVRTIDLVTLAGGLGALLLHRLDMFGALVVVAQTVCLLGVVAILELSQTRSERNDGEARPSTDRPA